jgi:hypothetical protein
MRNLKAAVTAILVISFVTILVGFWADEFFLAWIGWGMIFVTLEVYTLNRAQKGDTLSEQIWLGTLSKNKAWSGFWVVVLAVFMSWLTTHLLLGL